MTNPRPASTHSTAQKPPAPGWCVGTGQPNPDPYGASQGRVGLSGAFSGSEELGAHPIGDRLPSLQSRSDDERVLVGGESESAVLGAGVVCLGSAGSHETELYSPRKVLDNTYFRAHNKYMSSTAVILLIEAPDGDAIAVKFPNADQAMEWADEHDIYELGRPRLVTKSEALRILGG